MIYLCLVVVFLHFFIFQNSLSTERDYESLVLMRMRQAAERQKLIEQMQQEDEEEETVKTWGDTLISFT